MKYSISFSEMADFFINFNSIFRVSRLGQEPILIGGCGRSGTTLLLAILGAHPKIQAIDHEAYLFNAPSTKKNDLLRSLRINFNLIRGGIKPTADRWCEKTPTNVLKLKQIDLFFKGKFKFIHIIRDGRDVVTSRHPTKPDCYWVDIDRWLNDVQAGLEYTDSHNVKTIKYENLILDFKSTMKSITDFIGLDFVSKVSEFYKYTNIQNDRAWTNSVEKIKSKSIGRWKEQKYKERINVFYKNNEAIELLKKLDYSV